MIGLILKVMIVMGDLLGEKIILGQAHLNHDPIDEALVEVHLDDDEVVESGSY